MASSRAFRFILILMSVLATIGAFAQSGSTGTRSIKLVCDLWPPYQMMEQNGELTGFSIEVARSIFDNMNISIETIEAYPWKRALGLLEFGNADALLSANYENARTAFAYYPEEALIESTWLVWTRDAETIQLLECLKGKRVGVVLGYSYTRSFWDYIEKHCTIEKVFTNELNFKKLNEGRLDACVAEYGNGHYISKN